MLGPLEPVKHDGLRAEVSCSPERVGNMKPGDLVIFAWPEHWSKVGDPACWEQARLGLVLQVLTQRPDDQIGDELLVMHEGERWSVPGAWCKLIKEGE